MLKRKEALYYDEQLHPAFAGYLHDGTITERDSLAAIFHLLTKGILDPIWEDGSMLKKITGVRKMARKSDLEFNQILVDKLFGSKEELSAEAIRDLIKEGGVQNIIKNNLKSISAFPIINEELKFTLGKHARVNFSLNDNPVDTIEEATHFGKLLKIIFIPAFTFALIISIAALIFYPTLFPKGPGVYEYGGVTIEVDSPSSAFITAFTFLIVLLGFVSFFFTRKTVNYNFEKDVIPLAKKKYDELYEFIKTHPLPKHRFINEFLAFAIAFGFDDSWHEDFGLDKEIKLDTTPITQRSTSY